MTLMTFWEAKFKRRPRTQREEAVVAIWDAHILVSQMEDNGHMINLG